MKIVLARVKKSKLIAGKREMLVAAVIEVQYEVNNESTSSVKALCLSNSTINACHKWFHKFASKYGSMSRPNKHCAHVLKIPNYDLFIPNSIKKKVISQCIPLCQKNTRGLPGTESC